MILKRFVIRKSLIGKDVTIEFTNKKGEKVKYNHDAVYTKHKERFNEMNCFNKYKSSSVDSVNFSLHILLLYFQIEFIKYFSNLNFIFSIIFFISIVYYLFINYF